MVSRRICLAFWQVHIFDIQGSDYLSSFHGKYFDVTECNSKDLQAITKADKNLVLVYMPDLDYSEMEKLEKFAKDCGLKFLNIPITLPVMDIIKQAEYVGVEISREFIAKIRNGIMRLIVQTLNEEV